MSNTSDGDKREPGKVFPMDLAAKVAIMKSPDSSKNPSLVMTASGTQQLRTITQPQQVRVLTQAVASSVNPITTSTGGPTVISTHIVPQTMLKQVESGRSQSSLAATLTRPTQITLATASPGGTYHVPRGPAAVANMAAPRAAVATTVRGVTVSPQPIGAIVRGVAPPRTPSPSSTISVIPSGASWHGTTVQVQSAQPSGNKVAVTSPLLSPQQRTSGTAVPIVQGRAQVVGRTQPNISGQPRPTLLHTAVTVVGNQVGTQIHTFKSAGGTVQTLPTSVTLAQVVPSSRTQTLVYSSVSSGQHLTAAPRLAVASNVTQQRQITTGRSVQLSGPRLATPVSGATVHLTGPARLTVAQNTVLATGARISTIPTGQANVIGSAARITVTQPSNIGRLTITTTASQATILTTTPARLGQSIAGQTGATVLTTPTGRIQANVVSLHPVMVSNTSQPQLNLTQTRTLQGQGPKVITQPAHGAIQIAQVATVGKIGTQQQATVVPVSVAVGANRTVTVASGTVIGQRSISVAPNQQTVPLAKVFPQNTARTSIEASEIPSSAGGQVQQQQQTTNVYIPRASPGPNTSQVQPVSTSVTTYSIPSGTATYYYEAGTGYTVARSFAPSNVSAQTQQQAPLRTTTQQVHIGNQPFRFNQMMVVEQTRSGFTPESAILQSDQSNATLNPVQSTTGKSTSSPRPSILRKRDSEGSPLKAAKNLTPMLATLPGPPSPPSRPDSRGTGQSSAGSTTISATSSPGPDESPPPIVSSASMHSTRTDMDRDDERPILEMSPRKKPRKQQLTGNDLHEPKFNIEDMQFLCDAKTTVIKEEPMQQSVPEHVPEQTEVTVRKPTPVSLLHSYHQSWKSTHNHFLRYTDVKPKEDRRPSIMDLANQNRVLQKINGWKIYHLSTQMEDLSDLESQVYEKLSGFLKVLESKDRTGQDKDFDRINDLIKGNMQRSKIINEGLLEAKTQVMKIFDHKVHVADIINRCASKRNFKKREKS